MSDAFDRFRSHHSEGRRCVDNFRSTGDDFSLKHVWIMCISAFDLYMTELVSEAGLRLVDRSPRILSPNLRQVGIPLGEVLDLSRLNSVEQLIFIRDRIFRSIQFKSFYRPEKISEALSYIWTCPPKEKWARIIRRMQNSGRYDGLAEEDIRDELSLIGDRRDLIAHSADRPPGRSEANTVIEADAIRILQFIYDLADAIDAETESQLA